MFGEEEVEGGRVDPAVPRRRARRGGDRRDHPRARRGHGPAGRHHRGRVRRRVPRAPATARTRSPQRFASVAEQLIPAIDPVLVRGLQAAPGRVGPARDAQPGRARGRRGGPAPRRSPCASWTWSGSRGWAPQIEPQELGSVASKLAELANDVTEPPVRLVKTIGDAAMFVSPEPGPLVVGRAVAARGRRGGRPAEPAGRGRVRAPRCSAPATSTATRSTWPAG